MLLLKGAPRTDANTSAFARLRESAVSPCQEFWTSFISQVWNRPRWDARTSSDPAVSAREGSPADAGAVV
jgi:hypothetical protein